MVPFSFASVTLRFRLGGRSIRACGRTVMFWHGEPCNRLNGGESGAAGKEKEPSKLAALGS
jgi:hypothetical protein